MKQQVKPAFLYHPDQRGLIHCSGDDWEHFFMLGRFANYLIVDVEFLCYDNSFQQAHRLIAFSSYDLSLKIFTLEPLHRLIFLVRTALHYYLVIKRCISSSYLYQMGSTSYRYLLQSWVTIYLTKRRGENHIIIQPMMPFHFYHSYFFLSMYIKFHQLACSFKHLKWNSNIALIFKKNIGEQLIN